MNSLRRLAKLPKMQKIRTVVCHQFQESSDWRWKLHAARNHQLLVRAKVVKLFEQTPADDVRLISIKEEVFGIPDGRPIIDNKHPVLKEMFSQPIVGALCCFIFFSKQVVLAF